MLKPRLLNLLLITTSLIGYLEWGQDNSGFLFQMEWDVLTKMVINPLGHIHPFTILPLLGQLLLIISLFQAQPSKRLTRIAIVSIGVLLLMVAMVGAISLNFKVFLSALPFLGLSFYVWKNKYTNEDLIQ